MPGDLDSFYSILDLDSSATASDVREAYLDLVKVWHPDRFDQSPRLRQKAEEKLKAINAAYESLRSGAPAFQAEREQAARQPPPAVNPDYRPVDLGGVWGFADTGGRLVIRPRFEHAFPFSEGLAAAAENGRYGYVDVSGEWSVYPEFAAARVFAEGLAGVVLSELWGFIDRTGAFVVNPLFEDCGHFAEGFAAVRWRGRWGFIDREGRFAIKPRFAGARPFQDGWAEVQCGQKWARINRSGEVYVDTETRELAG